LKVRLVPAHVAGSGTEACQYLSTTLINDAIAIDAGCLGFYATPAHQAGIRHVLLSHAHLDHVASLPMFLENVYAVHESCVTIHASTPVLDTLQRDMFNDRLWPDFIALSRGAQPFLRLAALEPGQTVELEGVKFTAVPLNHPVPTVGFLIEDASSATAVISDTGPSEAIWQEINARPELDTLFLETAFPNEMDWLATVAGHLTPAKLATEMRKLNRPVRVIAIHLKPRYRDQVIAELKALKLPALEIGEFDRDYLL
jgi:ribonuclease BN (tRNA processing enzyme)